MYNKEIHRELEDLLNDYENVFYFIDKYKVQLAQLDKVDMSEQEFIKSWWLKSPTYGAFPLVLLKIKNPDFYDEQYEEFVYQKKNSVAGERAELHKRMETSRDNANLILSRIPDLQNRIKQLLENTIPERLNEVLKETTND